jgi:hypothetical protein
LLVIGSYWQIGLHVMNSSVGLPRFGIIITHATFNWAGKCPVKKTELHMDVTWTLPSLGSFYNNFPAIKSYPWAFLVLKSACIFFFLRVLDVKNFIGFVIYNCSVDIFSQFFIVRHQKQKQALSCHRFKRNSTVLQSYIRETHRPPRLSEVVHSDKRKSLTRF